MAGKNDFPDIDRDNAVEDFSQSPVESSNETDYVSPDRYEADEWAF